MAPIIEVSDETLKTLNPEVYNLRKEPLGWIQLPSRLYVAREITLLGKNFYEAQEALHEKGQRMLTPREFLEFLNIAKKTDSDLYNDVTQLRSPWRAEWLDADFKVENGNLVMHYHNFNEQGEIVRQSEVLDKDTLMQGKKISLTNLLKDSTSQGLPTNDTKNGELYYWAPRSDNNSVARFGADSVWADLVCGRNPLGRCSDLGVRAVRLPEKS